MAVPAVRRLKIPNAGVAADIAVLLERVCAQLPHDYTRQLVRDIVRLKLEMGFEGDVRDYLKRRSGGHPVVAPPSEPGRDDGA